MFEKCRLISESVSFNRTILELKSGNYNNAYGYYAPFNRTILELKYIELLRVPKTDSAFNRTILELK